jgi:hypothetical protein
MSFFDLEQFFAEQPNNTTQCQVINHDNDNDNRDDNDANEGRSDT